MCVKSSGYLLRWTKPWWRLGVAMGNKLRVRLIAIHPLPSLFFLLINLTSNIHGKEIDTSLVQMDEFKKDAWETVLLEKTYKNHIEFTWFYLFIFSQTILFYPTKSVFLFFIQCHLHWTNPLNMSLTIYANWKPCLVILEVLSIWKNFEQTRNTLAWLPLSISQFIIYIG